MQKSKRIFTKYSISLLGVSFSDLTNAQFMVAEIEPQAQALGYRTNNTTVDRGRYPRFIPDMRCGNCALFQIERSSYGSYGSCSLFSGKFVSVNGWCSAWARGVAYQSSYSSPPSQSSVQQKQEIEKLRAEAEEAKRKQAELEQQLRLSQNTQKQPPANSQNQPQSNPSLNQGRRVALVIGNASYSSVPQLTNPTNDAREVTRALQATGFEVIRLENADLQQMQEAVRSFGQQLGKNDVGLFYFSGHGVQVKGKNYLIPVRENIKQSFEVPSSAIDADLVLATMENAKNNLNIMILDACRSPFPGEARSLSRGLATLDAAKGTLIAYATAPGKEALDGQGSNSPYTKHLVRALQQKGLPIEQVFKQVRIAVVEETKGNQVPWENSSIMGDFYFRK